MKKTITILVTLCCFCTTAMSAEKASWFRRWSAEKEDNKPATFVETLAHGIGMGASIGLDAGWVRYYPKKYETQAMWESVGYGAYAGAGVGLAAAIIGRNGKGDEALSDIETGTSVGGGLGFFWGLVSALFTGDSEQLGTGLAWGNLGGFVLGTGYMGYKVATGRYNSSSSDTDEDTKTSVRLLKDSGSHGYPALCFETRF